jgi:hypothetical protein
MVPLLMALKATKETTNRPDLRSGLVDDTGLLEALFPDPESRPCKRWLRKMRTQRLIPCVKIGHRFVRFDVREVELALKKQFTREAKYL